MSHRNVLISVVFVSLLALLQAIMSSAQEPKAESKPSPRKPETSSDSLAPDLVISALSARFVSPDSVEYEWTITNVGTADANLDGPTDAQPDNVGVQAFVSKDTLYRNADDQPAGGTILGRSPLGKLAPGESKKGQFAAAMKEDPRDYPYLVLMVDQHMLMTEMNEDNNCAAVGLGLAEQTKAKPTGRSGR